MPGRTPTEAFIEFIAPAQQALGLIAAGRFVLSGDLRGLQAGKRVHVNLNNGDPVKLRSSIAGSLFLELTLRVETIHLGFGPDQYDCLQVGYWYALSSGDDREILAYHWVPDMIGNQPPFPHLHVGAIVSSKGAVAPDRFHKLHIPTGAVSVPAIVRCAIQEFGAEVRTGIPVDKALEELERLCQLG